MYMSALYNGQTISQAFHALQASRIKYKLEFVIVGAAYIYLLNVLLHLCIRQHCIMARQSVRLFMHYKLLE